MAWLAGGITVAAVIYAIVTTQQAKRSAAGQQPEAERETAPNVRASR
jgi:heme exporter protein D